MTESTVPAAELDAGDIDRTEWRRATPDEAHEWVKTGTVRGGRSLLVAGIGLMVPVDAQEAGE